MRWYPEPTTADFLRVRDELIREIREDADWQGRDHWSAGRWPMVHALGKAAATPPPESQIKNP